jgi:hypothetical protein
MQRQIDEADYILAVCTATYRRRFEGNEQPGRGKGAIFESLLTLQDLYDNATINEHIIPVLMGSGSDDAIPRALRAYTHYRLPDGYEALYRRITGQPALTTPPIGKVRKLPPRNRGTDSARPGEASEPAHPVASTARGVPMGLEARLASLLSEMFDAEELRTFLRYQVSKELADDLPTPGKVAKSLYIAEAAEKLLGRGLVTAEFVEAWAAARPGRAAEIRAVLDEK